MTLDVFVKVLCPHCLLEQEVNAGVPYNVFPCSGCRNAFVLEKRGSRYVAYKFELEAKNN